MLQTSSLGTEILWLSLPGPGRARVTTGRRFRIATDLWRTLLVTNIGPVGPRADRTRRLLQDQALDLFLARGYEATTVSDIAAAAGVSQMTFFRHFATKEAVVLDDPYDAVIAEAVLAQDADLPALERARRGFIAAWSMLPEPADDRTRDRIAVVARVPALRAAAWENNHRTGRLVTDALVADGVPRLEARVAAGACLGALMEALLDWGADTGGDPLGVRITGALGLLGPPWEPTRGSEHRP